MDEIRQRGLAPVLREALTIVRTGTAGFGVSIDLDAVDPADAPGVAVRVPGGLPARDLLNALGLLGDAPDLVALEIAEYDPGFDRGDATAHVAVGLACRVLAPGSRHLMVLEHDHGAHNYDPLPVVLARGEGVWVWDVDERRYLDMMSAYSAVSFGHAHPRLVAALTRQAGRLGVTSRAYHNDRLPLLLARITRLTGYERALPVNTGLEAVETALKAARKWAYRVKGVAAEQAEIIACTGNFHGRSIAIVGLSSEAQYRDGFGPFPPGLKLVPYGDADALEAAITRDTAAFLVEPIQGEGGVVVPPPGYLARCAEICRRHRVLLICDEVQTGLGRTGRLLASEHEGVRPDGVILGKALGGGLLPASAFLAGDEVMGVFRPGDHGSTFGGNPLAAAVALEALDVLVEEGLVERARQRGEYLLRRLRGVRSPVIREVRGRGLLVGVDLEPGLAPAAVLAQRMLHKGVLTKDTHGTVLRFTPPLVIEEHHVDLAVEALREVLREFEPRHRCVA